MRKGLLLAFVAASLALLTACSVVIGTGGAGSVPVNAGPRMDLVIDQVQHTYATRSTTSIIRSAWARNADLQSWFMLVDRVSDASNTMFLNATVGSFARDSNRVGTPKHGYTTYYSVRINVNFELIDAATGSVLAASVGSGSDSNAGSSANSENALRRAIDNGLVRLVQVYAGEG